MLRSPCCNAVVGEAVERCEPTPSLIMFLHVHVRLNIVNQRYSDIRHMTVPNPFFPKCSEDLLGAFQ